MLTRFHEVISGVVVVNVIANITYDMVSFYNIEYPDRLYYMSTGHFLRQIMLGQYHVPD